MSYQVLARKWRPKSFREMVGQEHVLRALINALDHNRLHHAYLFTGTRGVGKTTIARILAKCLNCDAGVSSEPCGSCPSCLEIAEGRSVDLLEVDAASRTKVEDTRELLDNVQYAPTRSRFKIYLIDEVHMLSTHSFNALLKTLEEPPPHVKFLLATTDPQKLPATILSRCLQFNLKNMPPEQIVAHLSAVLEREMVTYEQPALWLLGRAAGGSMRDALSLTDQAIAFGSGKVLEAEVRDMLGTVDLGNIYELLEAVCAGVPANVLSVVQRMAEFTPDFVSALDELLSLLHRVALAQMLPDAVDNSWGDAERVLQMARSLSAEDAQLFYQIALNGKRDIDMSPDPRCGFEMIMLRMIAFRPVPALDEIDSSGPAQPQLATAFPAQEGSDPAKKSVDRPRTTATGDGFTSGGAALSAMDARSSAVRSELTLDELSPQSWHEVLERLGLGGIVYNIASHCAYSHCEGNVLQFVLDADNAALFNDGHVERIQRALADYFKRPLAISVECGRPREETPVMRMTRLVRQRQEEAVDSIRNDAQLQALISRFDGELDYASILPTDS